MPSAKVIRRLVNNSSYVPASAGVRAFIVLDALRGPDRPLLVTSQRDFLDKFTSDGELSRTLPVGYLACMAYLAKSNQLYVRRVNGAGVETAVAGELATGDLADLDLEELDNPTARGITSDTFMRVKVGRNAADDADLYRDVSFFAADGGSWPNGWTVDMAHVPLAEQEVSHAYQLTVRNASGDLVQSELVSFDPNKTDNFGNAIYFADVLSSSNGVVATAADPAEHTLPILDQLTLTGGADATGPVQSADAEAVLSEADGLDIRLWVPAGYTEVGFQKALVAKAEETAESFALLEIPYALDKAGDITAISDWINNDLNVNSTQASKPLVGWLEVSAPGGGTRYAPPSGHISANLSQMMTNKQWWDIVAGFENGILTTPISVRNRWTTGQLDALVDGGANPIASFPGEGIVLWGQRTATNFPSALDRMNVALLIMFITIAAKKFLRQFLFRANTQETLDEIEAGLIAFGDSLKANDGVYEYRVQIVSNDFDKDNYRATVNFFVEPVKGIETIILNEVVVNTGELS